MSFCRANAEVDSKLWWSAPEPFIREIRLECTRRAYCADSGADEERWLVQHAVWRQKGHIHYLMYDEPDTVSSQPESPQPVQAIRTTLKLEPAQLTLVRHGALEWTHTFLEGQSASSVMRIDGFSIPILVTTEMLRTHVTEHGGSLDLRYTSSIAGEVQRTTLSFRFEAVPVV